MNIIFCQQKRKINNAAFLTKLQPKNNLDTSMCISNLKGYATSLQKNVYFKAVLDILRTYGPMTVEEVREECFNHYDKYKIEENEDSKKTIYECLFQHADCNGNSNADKQSKLFVRDNLMRYSIDPSVKL